jgi:CBS domain-containing protein
MSAPVVTMSPEITLREAARELTQAHVSGAPVVDTEGRCLGVLSSSDFVNCACEGPEVAPAGRPCSFIAPWGELINVDEEADRAIRNYMTKQPVTVAPETPIGELARIMVDAHIHRVLVVADHNRKSCGIVASTDVLAAVARAAQAEATRARRPRRQHA